MPIILATWEAEIEKITAQGQPGKIVLNIPPSQPIAKSETLSPKIIKQTKARGVIQ
jgi:hypothetical protein